MQFEMNVFTSCCNHSSSLPFKLIDWFLFEENIGLKLIKDPVLQGKNVFNKSQTPDPIQHLRWNSL